MAGCPNALSQRWVLLFLFTGCTLIASVSVFRQGFVTMFAPSSPSVTALMQSQQCVCPTTPPPSLAALPAPSQPRPPPDVCAKYERLYEPIASSIASLMKHHQGVTCELLTKMRQKCKEPGNACFGVTIWDHHLYFHDRSPVYESRAGGIKLQIFFALRPLLPTLRNFQFYVHNTDHEVDTWNLYYTLNRAEPAADGIKPYRGFVIPDWSFWSWPEVHIGPYWQTAERAARVDREVPFENRTPKLFWRGHPGEMRTKYFINPTKAVLKPDEEDIAGMFWGGHTHRGAGLPANYQSLHDFCRWRYLAHTHGGVLPLFSSRLKWLFMCGSVLLVPEMKIEEFWHHLMVPADLNNITVNTLATHVPVNYLFENVPQQFRKLKALPMDVQKRIGDNGKKMIAELVNSESVNCYWQRLLLAYMNASRCDQIALPPDSEPAEDHFLWGPN